MSRVTTDRLDVLHFLFGTSLLLHVVKAISVCLWRPWNHHSVTKSSHSAQECPEKHSRFSQQSWSLADLVFDPTGHVQVLSQSCPTLCHPVDCNPPGSSVHGILQARILEWVAMLSSRDLPHPGIKPVSPAALASQADSLPLSHHRSYTNFS